MKRIKGTMSILLTFMMLFVTFGAFGAYAVEEVAPVAPAPVEKLKAFSSYQSVTLKWKPVKNDKEGNAYPKGTKVKYLVNNKDVKVKTLEDGWVQYKTKRDLTPGKKYTFKVQAYIVGNAKKKLKSTAVTIEKAPVRRIAYVVKVRSGATLSSHRGKRAKYRLKSGQTLRTDRFATGRYIFDNNGSTYYVSRTRLGSKWSDYTTKFNYTTEEAEHFVNDRKIYSRTKSLIWVSTYTQHVYLFKGKKGNWECIDDWECATGTASTPTPTSMSGLKEIGRKIRSKNNLPYWSAFHGEASFHGKRSGWDVGKPASNGCVRNPNEKAKKIYKSVKKGSKVIFY